ncbi:hypothetical protein ACP70R_036145 [Stipagrostis hirtigluma subsp. patula]
METWASLPQDLVQLIGWRVLAGDLRDYVRFRAACSHWHASTVRPRGRGVRDPRFNPRRWMLLPDPDPYGRGELRSGRRDPRWPLRFLHRSTGDFARARLPLVGDHTVVASVDGLLLLQRDRDTAMRLLHPFTGDVAELPPLASILPPMDLHYARYGIDAKSHLKDLSATVAVTDAGEITVVLELPLLRRVAGATAGDQRWTPLVWDRRLVTRPVSFKGKLYQIEPQRKSDHFLPYTLPGIKDSNFAVTMTALAVSKRERKRLKMARSKNTPSQAGGD